MIRTGVSTNEKQPLSGAVYFEFVPIGRAVKVIAMCSVTGVEVAIVGDSKAKQKDLERLALRRLKRKLESDNKPELKFVPSRGSYH